MASNDNNAGNGAYAPNGSRRQFSPPRLTSSLPYAEWVEDLGLPHIPSPPQRTDAQLQISQLPYDEWVISPGLTTYSEPTTEQY